MGFSLDLSGAIANIKKGAAKTVRGTTLGIVGRIILRTPVGNPDIWLYFDKSKGAYVDYISARGIPRGYVGGSLRGAWQATLNSPLVGPLQQHIDANGSKTIAKANKVIKDMKIGDTFRLTNALPYARRVEFGWSSQAPQGMVRLSVAETQQILDAQQ